VPPGRTLELVTPTSNPSAQVDVLPFARIGSDGNEVAFQVLGDRDAGSSNVLNTYLSNRTANGWTVKRLSPPEAPDNVQSWELYPNPYFMFNSNLTEALYDAQAPAGSPVVAGEPSADNLYEQNTTTGASTLITTLPPYTKQLGCGACGLNDVPSAPRVAWATPDLQHVLFDNDSEENEGVSGQTVGANYFDPTGPDASYTYLWTPSQGMSIASIANYSAPDASGVPGGDPFAAGGAGALDPINSGGYVGVGYYGGNPHAISDDGTRIFFEGEPSGGFLIDRAIYQRRDQGQPDASTHFVGDGEFIDATPDGHEVLFSSCEQETPDSTTFSTDAWACQTPNGSAIDKCTAIPCSNQQGGTDQNGKWNKNDLYLWNEDGNGGAGSTTDLTTEDPNGADVLGVLGASTDLSRVYFVARGNLTGTAPAPSDSCNTAPGQVPNLYSWDRTDGIRYIAQLEVPWGPCFNGDGDMDTWQENIDAEHKDAAVSPDGSVLAFTTENAIDPAYDNVDTGTGLPHKEVYFYKYGSAGPVCVSCVGSGPATADATIANQGLSISENAMQNYPDWQKQNLLPDDNTLFFESGDRLSEAALNLASDVYEYQNSTGDVTLISSGTGPSPSNFMGATANGSDVFFSTDQSLLPSDIDNNINIYDARINGGVPNTPPATGCPGGCPTVPPTLTFVGPGNQTPAAVVPAPKPVVFALARLTSAQIKLLAKTGAVTLTITAPGAGKVSAKALARLSRGGALKTIGSASVTARKAGVLHLTLRLSAKARASLKKAGHLAVTIQASFGRTTKTLHITIKRP
jgi:hypothetical protein